MKTNCGTSFLKRMLAMATALLLLLTNIPSMTITGTAAALECVFTVTDGTDPLEGAFVTLSAPEKEDITGMTAADGTAVLQTEEGTEYSWVVTLAGYTDAEGILEADATECSAVMAEDGFSISGVVTDGTDPLEGAAVTLSDAETATDASGEFVFCGLDEGDYALKIQMDGYRAFSDTLHVDGSVSDLVFTLTEKQEQGTLAFEKEPTDTPWNTVFENPLTGVLGTGEVSYSCTGDAEVDENGTVTASKPGSVTVTAKVAEDADYKDGDISYTVEFVKAEAPLTMETDNCTLSIGQTMTRAADDGIEDSEILYQSDNEAVASVDGSGIVTAKAVGEATITASRAETELYLPASESFAVTVTLCSQSVVFEKAEAVAEMTVGGETYTNAAVGETSVSYESSNTAVATVDEFGCVTAVGAGEAEITATAASSELYEETPVSYTVKVSVGTRTIEFENGKEPTFVFNTDGNQYRNTATAEPLDGKTPVYRITDGAELVENGTVADDGSFVILGGGTITVEVSIEESENRYAAASESYTLTVRPAEQAIGFEQDTFTVVTGEAFAAAATEIGTLYGSGSITYEITENDDGAASGIDDEGNLLLTNLPGVVVVTAHKAADSSYKEAAASYTLTVTEWEDAPAESCTIEGQKTDDWYRADVVIRAADGYEVSLERDTENADWKECLTVSDEGKNEVAFYVRESSSGRISEARTETIRIDKTAPTAIITEDELGTWDQLLNIVSLGLWKKERSFTVTTDGDVKDGIETSGVSKVSYYLQLDSLQPLSRGDLEALEDAQWTEYTDPVSVDESNNGVFVIYAKAVDLAGNVGFANSEGIVYDVTEPTLTVTLPDPDAEGVADDGNEGKIGIYNRETIVAAVSASDGEPYSGIRRIEYKLAADDGTGNILKSGTVYEDETKPYGTSFEPESAEDAYQAICHSKETEISIPTADTGDGIVELIVELTDFAGNQTVKSVKMDIDTTAPRLSLTTDLEARNEVYYNGVVTATLKVEESAPHFISNKVTISVTQTPAPESGNGYEIGAWDESKQSAEIVLKDDAEYQIEISAVDAAGNEAQAVSRKIIVDQTKPVATVTVTEENTGKESVWRKLIEKLTFGRWTKNGITVSVETEDASPTAVEYFRSDRTAPYTVDELNAVTDWTTEAPVMTESELVTVYVRITDNAGNFDYFSTDGYIIDQLLPGVTVGFREKESGFHTYESGLSVPIYNKDVVLGLTVKDDEPYSGIGKVDYWVTDYETEADFLSVADSYDAMPDDTVLALGKSSEKANLFTFENDAPAYEELVSILSSSEEEGAPLGFITVNAEENNTCYVRLFVQVTDNAGNVRVVTVPMDIDLDHPILSVEYENTDGEEAKHDSFFAKPRKATVTVTERAPHFDAKKAVITVTEKPEVQGSTTWSVGTWDETAQSVEVFFQGSRHYAFSFAYTDNAGNAAQTYRAEFTVDSEKPTAEVEAVGYSPKWTKLLDKLTFGRWSNSAIAVKAAAADAVSPTEAVLYYVNEGNLPKSRDELELITEWTEEAPTVSQSRNFTVYVKATDYAGNTEYFGTDGLTVDQLLPGITANVLTEKKHTHKYANELEVPCFNEDAVIGLIIKDDAPYSGIRTVDYWVTDYETEEEFLSIQASYDAEPGQEILSLGRRTAEGNLFTFDVTDPAYEELVTLLTSESAENPIGPVTVNAEQNNTCFVRLFVRVADNAGNVKVITVPLDFDLDAPTVKVSYDQNQPENQNYFSSSRTATVSVTERAAHFDPERVVFTITENRVQNNTSNKTSYQIGEWKQDPTDPSQHSVAIRFDGDANYTFEVNGSDCLNNAFTDENVGYGTVAPRTFTVDKHDPDLAEIKAVSGWEDTWTDILSTLTFHLFTREPVTISMEGGDFTSPVTMEYFMTSDTSAKTESELNSLYSQGGWKEYSGDITITDDSRMVWYLRVTDFAGNWSYVGSDGIILDTEAPRIRTQYQTASSGKHTYAEGLTVPTFNRSVDISLDISDNAPYSGIKWVEYWIVKYNTESDFLRVGSSYDGNLPADIEALGVKTTDVTELFSFGSGNPQHSELVEALSTANKTLDAIHVDAVQNDSCYVRVFVRTADNSGNVSVATVPVDIDIDTPVLQITWDNNNVRNQSYYKDNRTATVTITDRDSHFEQGVLSGDIAAGTWSVNGNVHTTKLTFTTDGPHTISAGFTDAAGNRAESISQSFVIDKVAPSAELQADGLGKWAALIETLTFGLWSRDSITVSGTFSDQTSPMESVMYYISDSDFALSAAELDRIPAAQWTDFTSLRISNEQQMTVYVRAIDKAGNQTYVSTNGLILDASAPKEEQISPEITINPQQPVNGIYNRDVNVAIRVEEPLPANSCSGLREVRYRVLSQGIETQSGVLFTFAETDPFHSALQSVWTGSITVDAAKNNSNDVVIEVSAYDNAGNHSSESTSIRIDVTAPAISIGYDNNTAENGKYFSKPRTAVIRITERNFDPEAVFAVITNTDGAIPTLSAWQTSGGTGNGDDTVHTAEIVFAEDGDYTLDVRCSDAAGNASAAAGFEAGTANPSAFTVDRTAPVISVRYDNDRAVNETYFNAARTATVTVKEHNFTLDGVRFDVTASLDGRQISIPEAKWSHDGDIHTAVFTFAGDGDYTFGVHVKDLAGNEDAGTDYGNAKAPERFTVDRTIICPEITGIQDDGAYKDTVAPKFSVTDVNLDSCSAVLTRTRLAEKNTDVSELFRWSWTKDASGKSGNGAFDDFPALQQDGTSNDGIYTLTVKLTDKAGNEAQSEIRFSVNRFGSVYVYNDQLRALIADGGSYVQQITESVTITEYNADRLETLSLSVARDGKPVEEIVSDVTPTVDEKAGVGDSGWFQYVYTLYPENFAKDGVYKIVAASKDKAGNMPENAAYGEILFHVDHTLPELNSVTGLEKSIINAQNPEISYTVFDAISLASVSVYVNGELYSEITDFAQDGNNYNGSFRLSESSAQQHIRIVVTDKAGNVTDTDAESFTETFVMNRDVIVSTNVFVRWYANKPLFFGGIGGTAAAAGGAAFLIGKKRRKESTKA